VRGSGIGLSLVKHIAEAHGGHAWAQNAPDGGAVVGFALLLNTPGSRTEDKGASPQVPARSTPVAD